MRRLVWMASLLHGVAGSNSSPVNSTDKAANPQCYLMPILLLAPTVPLPKEDCKQPPLPSNDCVKEMVTATLRVLHNKDGEWTCLDDVTDVTILTPHVRYRGDSSLRFPKHQMLLQFDQPTGLLEFPPDTKWSLHGPFIDGSLMRNHLAHWLYRNTGRYSARTKHVALYIVNEHKKPKYKGVYLVEETIGYGPNRVGLAENTAGCTAQEQSGGWAWQYNPLTYGTYSPNIVTDMYEGKFGMGARPALMYPPGETLSQSMRDYFVADTGFLPQYYRYLFDNMTEPDLLSKHIDIGSYVDYFLHTEWSLNQDAYVKSAYFFKDRNTPIEAGPVWDLNLAYGLGSHAHTTTWLYEQQPTWKRLLCNYQFAGLAIARWKALRQTTWSNASINNFIDSASAPIFRQLAKCKHWSSDKDSCASVSPINQGSYADQLAILKASLASRGQWIDENIHSLYSKLDGAKCGFVGTIPNYNCAANGQDGGCVTNPVAYYSNLTFPPIRQPYTGPACPPVGLADKYHLPSIDPCWLSVGTYVTAGYITLTCSGYGMCPQGPNASCVCNNHAVTPDCSAPVSFSKASSIMPWISWMSGLYISLVLVVVFIKQRNQATTRPLSLKLKYGTD